MTDRELMQMALDALEAALSNDQPYISRSKETADALRARLAQPEPEPVAWMHSLTGGGWQVVPEKLYPTDQPLYTAPPQREWQGLTDEDIEDACWTEVDQRLRSFARAIEAKLKQKNT